jgi:hypothetical protein
MTGPYLNRLIVIRGMLNSPHPDTMQDGLDLLLELLEKNSEYPDFINEIKAMTNDLPALSSKSQYCPILLMKKWMVLEI